MTLESDDLIMVEDSGGIQYSATMDDIKEFVSGGSGGDNNMTEEEWNTGGWPLTHPGIFGYGAFQDTQSSALNGAARS